MLTRLDHLVLNVADIDRTVDFYTRVFGLDVRYGEQGRVFLVAGSVQIKLHGPDFEAHPRASRPTPGSADLCFISALPVDELTRHLEALNITIEEGPVPRHGAAGELTSFYVRDPDGNLVELARPVRTSSTSA
ncbi:VOC family protein [Larsenimonas rhizosphaerae]|uniref:VOC family protein n=1 Tax=Larsenimonas rhizosphaerae TaxID=2944682 RepID=A0AA42CY98_9GAMM|nr:VOC family protein [Larsenimonas rhizosphaerae]MCM2131799.1 VOC family protein [Larsenimonas rhizosphaerae]MCX2524885.1 VOC family protein [Larsenimonas rhizosphaerae]